VECQEVVTDLVKFGSCYSGTIEPFHLSLLSVFQLVSLALTSKFQSQKNAGVF
jgi:hypothetical protein